MHDINTIKAMNAENFEPGDRVRVSSNYPKQPDMIGRIGTFVKDDGESFLPLHVLMDYGDGGVDFFYPGELELVSSESGPATPEQLRSAHEAALKVLDDHEIKPFWQRSGYQIRQLLVEAILTERGLTKPE